MRHWGPDCRWDAQTWLNYHALQCIFSHILCHSDVNLISGLLRTKSKYFFHKKVFTRKILRNMGPNMQKLQKIIWVSCNPPPCNFHTFSFSCFQVHSQKIWKIITLWKFLRTVSIIHTVECKITIHFYAQYELQWVATLLHCGMAIRVNSFYFKILTRQPGL